MRSRPGHAQEDGMSATVLTRSGQQARPINRGLVPLWSVLAWEIRRLSASRLFWSQAIGFLGFLLLLTWVLRVPGREAIVHGGRGLQTVEISAFVAGASPNGLLIILPTILLVLVLLLPFVSADGVTRDLTRRTHELVVTTSVPTWAYVWGRYLAVLATSLGLALLLLLALIAMGEIQHLAIADYPAPVLGGTLLLWVGIVVPATVLVGGVGFALSTLAPRFSVLVKVGILVGWIAGAEVIPISMGLQPGALNPPSWYVDWDPTSGVTAIGLLAAYRLNPSPSITSDASLQQLVLSVENRIRTTMGWLGPHLLLILPALALVLIASLGYRRCRDVLS
jgi:ABC-type transport system involved in multi-copper enzyme maturation permease subunit